MNPRNDDLSQSDIPTEEELNHVMRARREKFQQLREMGVDLFPYSYDRTHSVGELIAKFAELAAQETTLSTAGRLTAVRVMGKAAFANILDEGEAIQIYIKRDTVGEASWELFKLLDIGDIIGVKGPLFLTRTGERTVEVREFSLLVKNLRPLPAVKVREGEIYNPWTDPDERYRRRPMDLLVNRRSRETALTRSLAVREIRAFLDEQGFIEVETPILQPVYGGAAARPFTTHHHSLEMELFLRIADELYLKRLVAGGMNRVYEIAKDFRNEGIDRLHSPEFTMLEFYAAYEDYNFCLGMMEALLPRLADRVLGSRVIRWEDNDIDFSSPFHQATMSDLIMESCDIEIIGRERDELAAEAQEVGIEVEPEWGVGKLLDEIFSVKVQPTLIKPTFVMDYPVELSPLAKRHRDKPGLVERFELFIGGLEIANAFSELNDPFDQRERFEEQARRRAQGDSEMPPIDEDFIETLELGMPPTAGLGMGIDRLMMLLTGSPSIRDVILFPILKPKR